jgi:hypothetical protein
MAIIGRQAPADIVVPAPQVSSRHAEIVAAGNGYYRLTDLGSSNGTFVNGARIQSAVITLSDQVSLGSHPFAVQGFAHLLSAAAPRPAGGGPAVGLPVARHEASGVAWEKRAEVGFFRGFLDTAVAILNRPGAFFRGMPPTGGLGSPLLFTVLAGALASVFVAVYQRLGWLPGGTRYPTEWLIYVLPLTIVVTPLLCVLGVLVGSCVDHLSLLVLGGARRGFEATARVEGYAAGGTAFVYVLPFVGPLIALLASLYLRIIGLSEAHQIGRGRSTAAVFLPLVVLTALVVALLLILVRQSAIPRGMFSIGFLDP